MCEKLVRSDLINRDIDTVIEVKTDLESAVKSGQFAGSGNSVERVKCLVSKLPFSRTQTNWKGPQNSFSSCRRGHILGGLRTVLVIVQSFPSREEPSQLTGPPGLSSPPTWRLCSS